MKKFKVGDRVIVDYSKQGIYNHVENESGIVVDIDRGTYLVKCDNDIGTFKESMYGNMFISDKNDLIWVEDKHITSENK